MVAGREPCATGFRAFFLAAGIFLSLLTYAYCQERIMTRPYEVKGGEMKFADTVFLVFVNRFFAVIAATVAIVVTQGFAGLAPQAPLERFPVVSLANLLATTCQYEALKWITLPTQTLFKCSKLIPVMMLSTLLSKRRYMIVDYLSAMCVALGCIWFMNGNIASRVGNEEDSWIGIVFMFGNVGFDSFLTAYQEKLFLGYNLSSNNQMLYVNLFSTILAFVIGLKEHVFPNSFLLLSSNREFQVDLFLLTTGAVSAQFFITCAIREFGAVFFGTVVTVQQVSSVMVSSLVLGTELSSSQWLSCVVVFGSIFAKNVVKLSSGLTSMAISASPEKRPGTPDPPKERANAPSSPTDIRVSISKE